MSDQDSSSQADGDDRTDTIEADSIRTNHQTIGSDFTRLGSVTDDEKLERNHLVKVEDGLAYVVGKGDDNTDGNFAIVDIYPPSSPTILGSLTNLNNAQTVHPLDDYALVADDDGLHSIDVSDPRDPRIRATLSPDHWERINDFAFKAGHLIACNKDGYLHTIDIRRPATPRLAGTKRLTARTYEGERHWESGHAGNWESLHGVDMYKRFAVIADSAQDVSEDFVKVYDIFDPETGTLRPPENWTEVGTASDSELTRANRVACQGTWAFVTTIARPSMFCVLDLSDPTAPSLAFSTELKGYTGPGCQLAGPRALVGGGSVLELWDVTTPADPVRIASDDSFTGLHDADIYGDLIVTPSDFDNTVFVHSVGTLRATGGWVGSLRTSKAYVEEAATVRELRVQDALIGPPGTELVTENTVTHESIGEEIDSLSRSAEGSHGLTVDGGEQWVGVPAAADHATRLKKIYPGNIHGGTVAFDAKMTGDQPHTEEHVGLSDDAVDNCLGVATRDGTETVVARAEGDETTAEVSMDLTTYRTYRLDWSLTADAAAHAIATVWIDGDQVARFTTRDHDCVPTTRLFFTLAERTDPDTAPDEPARTYLRDGPRIY